MYTEIPMDTEIETIGDYYHDPSLPDSVPTFQYCTVRVGQKTPDVPHETLAELFLMEETNVYDEEEATANKTASALWESLEDEAYRLVGLEDAQTTEENPGNTNKSKWRPGGYLRYHDTTTGRDIPMEGVPVRYQKLVVVHQCCTDANGHFSFGRRRSKVRYYAKWRRDDFHIRGLGKVFAVAETSLSGNTKSQIDMTFNNPEHAAWKYASVFRAAHTYYYKHSELGLSKPGDRNLCIRLSCMTPDGRKARCMTVKMPGTSDIKIYYHNLSTSENIFHSTFHEIAHSAHKGWGIVKYLKCDNKVQESWARGVAWFATKRIYPSHSIDYYGDYTGIVEDLIDDKVNYVETKDGESVKDDISGITMTEIERALRTAETWDEWANNVAIYGNNWNEKQKIRALFGAWGNCRN